MVPHGITHLHNCPLFTDCNPATGIPPLHCFKVWLMLSLCFHFIFRLCEIKLANFSEKKVKNKFVFNSLHWIQILTLKKKHSRISMLVNDHCSSDTCARYLIQSLVILWFVLDNLALVHLFCKVTSEGTNTFTVPSKAGNIQFSIFHFSVYILAYARFG